MAAPMKPASPTRDAQIKAKEDAIKRRLDSASSKAKTAAQNSVNAQAKKYAGSGRTFTKNYTGQAILGKDKGFTKSDYGVGAGAAIPYQTGNVTKKVSATATKKKAPERKPKPKASTGGHSSYKVQRGDTLSGIAKKHGMNWQDIWNYNLKNRKSSTVKTLKKRGPNLIFRGGTFYIPNK